MFLLLGTKSTTESQAKVLMERFKANPHPQQEETHQLAKSLNVSNQDVVQRFCNTRQRKSKKESLEKSE